MPRAPAKIRKRYIEGQTEVLDWEIEECLLWGCSRIFGPSTTLKRRADWLREWNRWRDVVLPKALKYFPGTRPFALYAIGEIPPRKLAMPLPEGNGYWSLVIDDPKGKPVTHWLNVDEPYMDHEVWHLKRLKIVDAAEYRRFRKWLTGEKRERYPLEMSLFD